MVKIFEDSKVFLNDYRNTMTFFKCFWYIHLILICKKIKFSQFYFYYKGTRLKNIYIKCLKTMKRAIFLIRIKIKCE